MGSKTTLIINRERDRNDIIYDIFKTVKNHGYEKDTMSRLKGIKNLPNEEQFQFMVRKICKSELKNIKEVIFCGSEKFRKYIEKK